ncbi:hypothetical protein CHCC20331_0343 [Bacillus paralicheniformis]|nr:hypothetical protein CHCC20331_0343 [Bacillus paralicheniformis]
MPFIRIQVTPFATLKKAVSSAGWRRLLSGNFTKTLALKWTLTIIL